MFNFLFKYPETVWQQSEFAFASGWPVPVLALCVFIAALCLALSMMKRPLVLGGKAVLWVLQLFAVSVLLIMLWQPTLRLKVVDPADNSVILLVDTSRSMSYEDSQISRISSLQQALKDSALIEKLSAVYQLGISSVASSVTALAQEKLLQTEINAIGKSSNIADALLDSVESASAQVIAGVVLISDGGNTSEPDPSFWQRLSEAPVPVYTVGVGQSVLQGDLAIYDVEMSSIVTRDSTVAARVGIRYAESGPARLRIYDGKHLLYAKTLNLPEGGSELNHQAEFITSDAGIRELKFELEPRLSEKNSANNSQRRILNVQDTKRRILYVEGEPRWEFKFIRRALHNSPEIELVTLLHTSSNKFYRQGVRNERELADGFPVNRVELFEYDGIIIGSLEAAQLTEGQQQNIRDFVRVRGGSLLMLAGSNGLSSGGWSRSSVAQALPVSMGEGPDAYLRKRAQVDITEPGLQTDWLRLDDSDEQNLAHWQDLPPLADVQLSGTPKAGATVLLEAVHSGERQPLLVWQRYGRGKSYILATSGTWRWQMSLPAADHRHEKFWQGLLGDVVSAVLPRLAVETSQPVYLDQNRISVVIDARDNQFEPDAGANIRAVLRGPDGDHEMALNPDPDQPGRFRSVVDAETPGEYSVKVIQTDGEHRIEKNTWFLRQDNLAEDFALALDRSFLERVALETGGKYLALADIAQLPDAMRQSSSRLVRNESLPLWNLPAAFLLLLLLKLLEWALRLRWNRL